MSIAKNTGISVALVQDLIREQFPQWINLSIRPVEFTGWDNRTFRLGSDMSVRLPSAERYSSQVMKEQKWLPVLAKNLSFQIPMPLALGKPSSKYPWNWSIYRWIDGQSADTLQFDDFQVFAEPLARCLKELHTVESFGGPLPGIENFYRGGNLTVCNTETKEALSKLEGKFDVSAAEVVWEKALNSKWVDKPVWVHGDYSVGNVIVNKERFLAVIDFGSMAIGDPACDLVFAWTNFNLQSRRVFKSILNLDTDTWDRARGWALWKALTTFAEAKNPHSKGVIEKMRVVSEILADAR